MPKGKARDWAFSWVRDVQFLNCHVISWSTIDTARQGVSIVLFLSAARRRLIGKL